MRFKPALWDESDPTYAPLMSRARQFFYWKASAKFIALGYPKALCRQKLTGEVGDGNDLTRAAECRKLTRDMVEHFKAETFETGTWAWIIHRYRTDEESGYQDVKSNTRQNYDMLLDHWAKAIGKTHIANADYRAAKRWANAMKERGRSTDWIHRMFVMLRTVTRYGALLGEPECIRFKSVLSDMKIKTAKPVPTEGTPEQIAAIVAAAQADGRSALVLGWAMQWWFGLRAVDVRGQWLSLKPGEDVPTISHEETTTQGRVFEILSEMDFKAIATSRFHRGMESAGVPVEDRMRFLCQTTRSTVNDFPQSLNREVARLDRSKRPSLEAYGFLFGRALMAPEGNKITVSQSTGLYRNGKRWADGLTWDMIDRDVSRLVKTFSKTASRTAASAEYDLTQVPEIRALLLATPTEKRVGPVIVNPTTGLPYTIFGWSKAWRKYRRKAGVPEHVKNMGTRASAATDARARGASAFDLRDVLGHANVATTNRYVRGRGDAVSKVIDLRRGKKA